MRIARWGLALGAVAWVIALFAAPAALFPIGTFICHQRPERSFFFHGHQLPVCGRCTGLYIGAAVAAPVALALAAALPASRARWMLAIAAIPTAVTWLLEFGAGVPFSNTARFVAALPLGFAAAWLVLSTIAPRASRIGPRTPVR